MAGIIRGDKEDDCPSGVPHDKYSVAQAIEPCRQTFHGIK
jgi:hypothetical protein